MSKEKSVESGPEEELPSSGSGQVGAGAEPPGSSSGELLHTGDIDDLAAASLAAASLQQRPSAEPPASGSGQAGADAGPPASGPGGPEREPQASSGDAQASSASGSGRGKALSRPGLSISIPRKGDSLDPLSPKSRGEAGFDLLSPKSRGRASSDPMSPTSRGRAGSGWENASSSGRLRAGSGWESINEDATMEFQLTPTLDNADAEVRLSAPTPEGQRRRPKRRGCCGCCGRFPNCPCGQCGRMVCLLTLLALACALYSTLTLMRAVLDAGIAWTQACPRPTICTGDRWSLGLLLVSRLSAYFMYPYLMGVFYSKCKRLMNFGWQSQLKLCLGSSGSHSIHTKVGMLMFILAFIHSVFHLARWAYQGTLLQHLPHQSSITGLVAWACSFLLVLPMAVEPLRKRLQFQVRKGLHVIVSPIFGLCLALHAPETHILYVMLAILLPWVIDYAYVQLFMTHEVTSSQFYRLDSGVVLHFKNPKGFSAGSGGYVNICVPFISKYEWHAFSIHPFLEMENHSCVYMANVGDWTGKLHEETELHTTRPSWVQGPFMSPYNMAVDFDNIICVATGVGITPGIATMQQLKGVRRVNLLWMCRDASMVEFYLNNVDLNHNAWTLLYYTGKRKPSLTREPPKQCLVFNKRPNLPHAIKTLITAKESGHIMPEAVMSVEVKPQVHPGGRRRTSSEFTTNHFDGLNLLQQILQKALESHTPAEIIEQLGMGNRMTLARSELIPRLQALVPQADIPRNNFQELAQSFSCGDDTRLDTQKLLTHCRATMGVLDSHEGRHCESEPVSLIRQRLEMEDSHREYDATWRRQDSMEQFRNKMGKWCVMYCGGSVPVIKALDEVCAELGVTLRVEKFDW